jgi:hypothetical protein
MWFEAAPPAQQSILFRIPPAVFRIPPAEFHHSLATRSSTTTKKKQEYYSRTSAGPESLPALVPCWSSLSSSRSIVKVVFEFATSSILRAEDFFTDLRSWCGGGSIGRHHGHDDLYQTCVPPRCTGAGGARVRESPRGGSDVAARGQGDRAARRDPQRLRHSQREVGIPIGEGLSLFVPTTTSTTILLLQLLPPPPPPPHNCLRGRSLLHHTSFLRFALH